LGDGFCNKNGQQSVPHLHKNGWLTTGALEYLKLIEKSKCFRSLSVDLERERFASTDATTRTPEARFYERGIRAKISLSAQPRTPSASHLTSARTHRSFRASALQTWRDVKIARAGRNNRRRETACLRLLAMREFDHWGRRRPVEGPHRFKIAASTFLDRKFIQETRFPA